jgi:hypothetical protein
MVDLQIQRQHLVSVGHERCQLPMSALPCLQGAQVEAERLASIFVDFTHMVCFEAGTCEPKVHTTSSAEQRDRAAARGLVRHLQSPWSHAPMPNSLRYARVEAQAQMNECDSYAVDL